MDIDVTGPSPRCKGVVPDGPNLSKTSLPKVSDQTPNTRVPVFPRRKAMAAEATVYIVDDDAASAILR